MEFIIIGIVSALNLIVIVHKFKKKRVEDGIFDSFFFVTMLGIFNGTYSGMVVGMISSLIVSIYLWASPPTFFRQLVQRKDIQDTLQELKGLVTETPPKNKTKKQDLDFD